MEGRESLRTCAADETDKGQNSCGEKEEQRVGKNQRRELPQDREREGNREKEKKRIISKKRTHSKKDSAQVPAENDFLPSKETEKVGKAYKKSGGDTVL